MDLRPMMEILPIESNAPLPQDHFLPDDLIVEILCLLSVKNIVQLKCVSKSWNTLISDPTFIQKHLKISSQNPHLILTPEYFPYPMSSVQFLDVQRFLENPITVSGDNCHGSMDSCQLIGSCHGLLCLHFHSRREMHQDHSFCLWNPATRTRSEQFGIFQHINHRISLLNYYNFTFCCDILTGTYKVVLLCAEGDENKYGPWKTQVKVLSLGDNYWRDINTIPLLPYNCRHNSVVHLSGTVYWLAIQNYFYFFYEHKFIKHTDQFVIVSLDLSTETYKQFFMPSAFDEVPIFQPTLHVLQDCLCFSHDSKGIEFVIWQMKEFGVQESWTQLFRIAYFNHKIYYDDAFLSQTPILLPMYLSKNGDTLILAYREDDKVIIYNQSEKRIRVSKKLRWCSAMNYVESLASTDWKFASSTPSMSFVHGSLLGKPGLTDDDREFKAMIDDDSKTEAMDGDGSEEEKGPLLSEDLDNEDEDELSDNDSGDEQSDNNNGDEQSDSDSEDEQSESDSKDERSESDSEDDRSDSDYGDD